MIGEKDLIFLLGLILGGLAVLFVLKAIPWLSNTFWLIREIIRTRGKILEDEKKKQKNITRKDRELRKKMESLNFEKKESKQ